MSLEAFLIAYAVLATLYLWPEPVASGTAAPPRRKASAIRTVTDLRLGVEHPTRGSDGRFISKRQAADEVYDADLELEYDFDMCLNRPLHQNLFSSTPWFNRMSINAELWSITRNRAGQLVRTINLPF